MWCHLVQLLHETAAHCTYYCACVEEHCFRYIRSSIPNIHSCISSQEWDPELAEIAQQYAQLCIFDHNPYRSALSQRFSYVGENIAITNNPVANFTALTEGWYNERLFYDIMSCQCMEKECLHYTQVRAAVDLCTRNCRM